MKLLRKLTAFILVFGLLAGTVAVMSAAARDGVEPLEETQDISLFDAEKPSKGDLAATSAASYTPRLEAPGKDNEYYYSDKNIFYKYGWGMPNCTCYAWGRAYELLGSAPSLCVYSAYLWYDYNKDNDIYAYGDEPRPGAIACWVYSSGAAGHVAVVEKIEDGEITFSNSAYGSTEFYLSTAPVDDPSDGVDYWIFQGYIYIGDYEYESGSGSENGQVSAGGPAVGDVYRITSDDGVNLRKGAGTSYKKVGFIDYGQDALVTDTVTADGYTWGHTVIGGVEGWFVTDFAKLIYRETGSEVTPPEPDDPNDPSLYGDAVIGDLDGDGVLTIIDATRIQLILADLCVPTKYMLIVGDYDGDSELSVLDVTAICYDLAYSSEL